MELDVKHFSFENLVDLAREFAPADEGVAMLRHGRASFRPKAFPMQLVNVEGAIKSFK
jgi:hypothetical protein